MLNKYCKTSLLLFFTFFIGAAVNQAPNSVSVQEYRGDGLYLENISIAELQEVYDIYQYKDYIYMPDWKYPPIFLKTFPTDYYNLKDTKKRNKLFIQILAPLALKLADEILIERYEIIDVKNAFEKNHELTPEQEKFIEEKAKKYDIFTRLKGNRRYSLIFKQLLLKVDKVSPSLLIGVAAVESNWGTSRPVKLGNGLYKELAWYGQEGLDPIGEDEDKSYKIRTFPSLYDAMQSYALKINSNINFEYMRFLRAEYRWREQPVLGRTMAHTMIFASPLKNYGGLLDYTITFYELNNFDDSLLGGDEIPNKTRKLMQ